MSPEKPPEKPQPDMSERRLFWAYGKGFLISLALCAALGIASVNFANFDPNASSIDSAQVQNTPTELPEIAAARTATAQDRFAREEAQRVSGILPALP